MGDFIDVNIKDGSKNPVKMAVAKYTHPSLKEGEYILLFANSNGGLVFNEKYLIGLYVVL